MVFIAFRVSLGFISPYTQTAWSHISRYIGIGTNDLWNNINYNNRWRTYRYTFYHPWTFIDDKKHLLRTCVTYQIRECFQLVTEPDREICHSPKRKDF